MMGQLLKNNSKKGRPSNSVPETESQPRRSGRRRNVRCTFDFDDYLDDDEYFFVEEEEDERRREKKIKLLLKLHSSTTTRDSPLSRRKLLQSLASCSSASDNENNNYDRIDDNDEVEGDQMHEATSKVDYAPGIPTKPSSECPLPDKNVLELLLRKLQKKDIYGVYAEPVDPEELPDYHDLIANPMDFSTIRSKLGSGLYATLEQFESDIFLLCSNAMQYNEPDTIYHKQARSIQDLAKRKFQKLRIDNERLVNQIKSEAKPKPPSVFKKQIRRQTSRVLQEPIESDYSAGTTPPSVAHTQDGSNVDVLVKENHFVIDTSVDQFGESLAERGLLHGFARKTPIQDNNHATYSIGSQPNAISDSSFSTFDGETNHLVPVGLHVEHAYARSLARFAGTLGCVAWRVASKRIEQILPPGAKFGRGWVGEYEPLSTPVLIPDYCNIE